MKYNIKNPIFRVKNIVISSTILVSLAIFSGIFLFLTFQAKDVEGEGAFSPEPNLELNIIQGNSLIGIADHSLPEPKVAKTLKVLATAYSSTPWETDDTPFITASGSNVKDGIVANNQLPFGTKIRIPEVYGDKIFTVEDRMHWSKSGYYLDIWFANTKNAKEFGVKRTYIEVIEG